ncbi:MAG: DUF721 domain-containing protein [Thermodesulfobacteriota bacterium]|nr:DUF721 domain-containing protein [Thermodesulfobacteriota bacterium]
MKKISEVLGVFLTQRDAQTRFQLSRLWRDWNHVVGPEIASLAEPLGHKKTTLRIGVPDSMVMQEMTHYSPVVLEQVNAYLGMNFFDKIQLELLGNQVSLNATLKAAPSKLGNAPVRPKNLGGLVEKMPRDSAMAKCYGAYVRLFSGS